jgi:hypothetical protein
MSKKNVFQDSKKQPRITWNFEIKTALIEAMLDHHPFNQPYSKKKEAWDRVIDFISLKIPKAEYDRFKSKDEARVSLNSCRRNSDRIIALAKEKEKEDMKKTGTNDDTIHLFERALELDALVN